MKKESKFFSVWKRVLISVLKFIQRAKWVLLCALVATIFSANIAILLFVPNPSNWLTLYSGWLSAVATIIIGIITIWQGRKYKRENEIILSRQTIANFVQKEIMIIDDVNKELANYLSATILFNELLSGVGSIMSNKSSLLDFSTEINVKINNLLAISHRVLGMKLYYNERNEIAKSINEYSSIIEMIRNSITNLTNTDIQSDVLKVRYLRVVANVKKLNICLQDLQDKVLDYSEEYEYVVSLYDAAKSRPSTANEMK
ncbi:MAG: hypothetical protein R3Y45_08470 [Bacillota bacterium]